MGRKSAERRRGRQRPDNFGGCSDTEHSLPATPVVSSLPASDPRKPVGCSRRLSRARSTVELRPVQRRCAAVRARYSAHRVIGFSYAASPSFPLRILFRRTRSSPLVVGFPPFRHSSSVVPGTRVLGFFFPLVWRLFLRRFSYLSSNSPSPIFSSLLPAFRLLVRKHSAPRD